MLTAVTQVNLRLALSVQFHTRWHYIAIYGSICLWLAFVCAYNALPLGTLGSIAHQVVPPPARAVYRLSFLRDSGIGMTHLVGTGAGSSVTAEHHLPKFDAPVVA